MYLLATVQNVIMHVALFLQFVLVLLFMLHFFVVSMLLEFRNPIQSPYLKNIQEPKQKLNIQQTRC